MIDTEILFRIKKKLVQFDNFLFFELCIEKGNGIHLFFYNRSDIARQYKAKMSEIELKRIELMRLNQEFESKMRSKEVKFVIYLINYI